MYNIESKSTIPVHPGIVLLITAVWICLTACFSKKDSDSNNRISNWRTIEEFSQDEQSKFNIKFKPDGVFIDINYKTSNWYKKFSGVDWLAGIVVDSLGRVFIGSQPEKSIHVYNFDGRYLRRIGNEGTGPGEFRSIVGMKIIKNKVLVFDRIQLRLNIFHADSLKLIHTINTYRNPVNLDEYVHLSGWFVSKYYLRHDGTFLIGLREHPIDARMNSPSYNLGKKRVLKYYFMDHQGQIMSNQLFELRDREDLVAGRDLYNHFSLPFLGQSIVTISEDGYIFTNWTERFMIDVYNQKGDYLHSIFYPIKKEAIILDEIIELIDEQDERSRALVQQAELPEYWPGIRTMVADDENRLWVSVYSEGVDNTDWYLLSYTGELLARFSWPGNRQIEVVKNDKVYVRETDPETGLQQVVRYGFELVER